MWKIIITFTSFFKIMLSYELMGYRSTRFAEDKSDLEYLCINDDINEALSWNFPTDETYQMYFKWNTTFSNKELGSCTINTPWQITHSYENPMGPVYDSRWEHFRIYRYADNKLLEPSNTDHPSYGPRNLFKNSGALVFSIKGHSIVRIFLCTTQDIKTGICYQIEITNSIYPKATINKSEHGIPEFSSNNSNSQFIPDVEKDFHKWKTMILLWGEKKIQLFDDELAAFSTLHDVNIGFNNDTYYVYFSNPAEKVALRFHEYEYYYTTNVESKMDYLISFNDSDWQRNFHGTICIDIQVGLCPYCWLTITVIDAAGQTLQVQRFPPEQGINTLPMWRQVKLHFPITPTIKYPIKLELQPNWTKNTANVTGHWAVYLPAQIYPRDTLKGISLRLPSSVNHVWCQRLSYVLSRSERVYLNNRLRNELIDDDGENCSNGGIGPRCAFPCNTFFSKGCDNLVKCTKSKRCSCNSQLYLDCENTTKIDPPSFTEITSTSAQAFLKATDRYIKHSFTVGFELKVDPDDKTVKLHAGRLGKSNNSDERYFYTSFTNLKPGTTYSVRTYITYKYGKKSKTIMGKAATFKTLFMTLGLPALVTMVQEGKGNAILSWKPPDSEQEKEAIKTFALSTEIIASKLEEKPIPFEKQVAEIVYDKSIPEYTVHLNLFPSTHYRISIQAIGENTVGNTSTIEIKSQSALAFKYAPSATLDDKNRQITIIIPPVGYNTEHSMLYIIVKGSPICKQGGSLKLSLKKIIGIEENEISWMAAKFLTSKTADKSFIVGDELIYNDVIANCPLHRGSSYVIYILVRERGDQNELQDFPALLWTSPEFCISSNSEHWKYWAIPLVVIIMILCGIVYRYYRT